MLLRTKNQRGLRRGMGTVSTPVAGTIVFGSNPVRPAPRPIAPIRVGPYPVRAVGPAYPISRPLAPLAPMYPGWQNGGSGPSTPDYTGGYGSGGYGGGNGWSAGGSPFGSQPNSNSLATAQALLASNPSLLTQAQWSQLQAAGLVSSSLPYSSASLVTTTAGQSVDASAIDPATGVPYATELAAAQTGGTTDIGTTLSETVLGLPLYLWLAIAGGGFLLLSRSGGRR